jgi:chromosomal replication initiation ATPase DnaA
MGEKLMKKHKMVLDYIAEEFGVDNNYYNNKSRYDKYAKPRKMACWVLYNVGQLTMTEVGKIIGYAEHTTVLYHIHDYWYLCKSDDDFKEKGYRIYSKANEIYETN